MVPHASLPWLGVLRQTWREVIDDNCLGLAAQLSFYFLLALFPAVLFVVALLGFLPVDRADDELLRAIGAVAPAEFVALVGRQLDVIARDESAGLLTLGLLGALWSSSAAVVAIIDALNRAYDIVEWRPWWKRRLLAIFLTVALAVVTLLSMGLVITGPDLALEAADWLDLAPQAAVAWGVLRWPVLVACVIAAVDLVFYVAPNRQVPWRWVTPGALVATAGWIAVSFGFKFYVANFGDYTATHGAIGGAIVTMLWFYVSSLVILVGAELNAVLEQSRRQVRG